MKSILFQKVIPGFYVLAHHPGIVLSRFINQAGIKGYRLNLISVLSAVSNRNHQAFEK